MGASGGTLPSRLQDCGLFQWAKPVPGYPSGPTSDYA